MTNQLLIIVLGFIAGIAGNLIAGWIQQDIWKDVFNRTRIAATFITAIIAMLVVATFSGAMSVSYEITLSKLVLALANPISLIAFLAFLAVWLIISLREKRLRTILQNIDGIPEKDRKSLLETEMGIKLPKTITPEDWLKARKQLYNFVLVLSLIFATGVILIMILLGTQQPSDVPELNVEVSSNYMDTEAQISNIGSAGIIIIDNISIETTNYRSCPYYAPAIVGAPITTYEYNLKMFAESNNYLLDNRTFKYSPGDIDRFLIKTKFEEGIYNINFNFDYRFVGDKQNFTGHYQSKNQCLAICFAPPWFWPGGDPFIADSAQGTCDELPERTYSYITYLIDNPPSDISKQDMIDFVRANYPPCEELRSEYIRVTHDANAPKCSY